MSAADLSLALFALPHAGYSEAFYEHIRRLLLGALGDRLLEPVAVTLSPKLARVIVRDAVDAIAASVTEEVAA